MIVRIAKPSRRYAVTTCLDHVLGSMVFATRPSFSNAAHRAGRRFGICASCIVAPSEAKSCAGAMTSGAAIRDDSNGAATGAGAEVGLGFDIGTGRGLGASVGIATAAAVAAIRTGACGCGARYSGACGAVCV